MDEGIMPLVILIVLFAAVGWAHWVDRNHDRPSDKGW